MEKKIILFFLIFGIKNLFTTKYFPIFEENSEVYEFYIESIENKEPLSLEDKLKIHQLLIDQFDYLIEKEPQKKLFAELIKKMIFFSDQNILSNDSNISITIRKCFFLKFFQKFLNFFC